MQMMAICYGNFKKKAATEECITMKHRVYQNRTLSFYLEF